MKFVVNASDILGKAIANAIGELDDGINKDVEDIVKDVSKQAFWKLKEKAESKLYRTKDQYIQALRWAPAGNGMYVITLDATAAHLEEGYESYDMKPGLLHLGKAIPLNAKGEPAIKTSKKGYRYRSIPIDHNQAAAKSNHPLANVPQGTVGPNVQGRLRPSTYMGTERGTRDGFKSGSFGGTTKDRLGAPILGKVATMRPNPNNKNQVFIKDHTTGVERAHTVGRELHPNSYATKFQYEQKNRNGGTTVKSAYVSFRIVSEDPAHADKWIHPGFRGIHAFPEVQAWAERTLEKRILELISGQG